MSQWVGVGLGSAARSTSSTSRRKFVKIEILPPHSYCRWTVFTPFRDFSRLATILLQPSLLKVA